MRPELENTRREMEAFDRLPARLRAVLREADFSHSPKTIEAYLTKWAWPAEEVASLIREQDAELKRQFERMR